MAGCARALAAVALSIVVCAALWFALSFLADTSRRRPGVEALGTSTSKSVPRSEGARVLAEVAAGTGLALTRESGSTIAQESFDASHRQRIRIWLDANVARAEDDVLAPDDATIASLGIAAPHMKAIRDAIQSGGPIHWEETPELGPAAAFPDLRAHFEVQRLLLATALECVWQGDPVNGSEFIDASWKLNESLFSRPEVATQSVAIAISRLQLGVLRKAGNASGVWRERLAEDRAEGIVRALEHEAGWTADAMRRPDWVESNERRTTRRLAFAVIEPYYRLAADDYTVAVRQALTTFRSTDPCARSEGEPGVAFWNRLVPASAVPDARVLKGRLARLQLESELTGNVLELRASGTVTAERRPSRCGGFSWNVEPASGGGWSIELEPADALPRGPGLEIALRHREVVRP